MPLADLSTVTDALRSMISAGIAASDAWAPNPAPAVEPLSPEAMSGEGLTLYLYGVGENATAGNQAGRRGDQPLGLDLHYQLVAHGGAPATTQTMRREQLLLGLGMKVLHDHPRLQSGVIVGGVDIFGSTGIAEDNTLSITLLRLEPEQAVTWWTATQSGIRAAAYYTVAVALIQEGVAPVSAPPVLVREVFGFAGMAPHVSSSAATLTVARPGSDPASVRTSPAQVPPGAAIELTGAGFTGNLTVTVRGETWPDWQPLGGASLRVAGGVETVVTTLDPRPGGQLVVPGLLRVRVSRAEDRRLGDGSVRSFTFASNETAVSVVPVVDGVTTGNPHVISGGPFEAPGIDPASVRLSLGSEELLRVGGAPAAGELRVLDRDTIEFLPPPGVASGETVRLRLLVNGAECLPTWYVAP